MKKYKIRCESQVLHTTFILTPAICCYKEWDGYGIEFGWLMFAFAIHIIKNYEDKYYTMEWDGENTVEIKDIVDGEWKVDDEEIATTTNNTQKMSVDEESD